MQEHARASIIIPMLLRCHLKDSWVRADYFKGLSQVSPGTVFSPVTLIIQCFADIARSNDILLSRSMSPASLYDMQRLIVHGRKAFQHLYQVAFEATSNRRRTSSISRSPSPSLVQPSSRCTTHTQPSRDSSQPVSRTEFEDLTNAPPSKIDKGALDFMRAQARPNVHLGLHYLLQYVEYGMN